MYFVVKTEGTIGPTHHHRLKNSSFHYSQLTRTISRYWPFGLKVWEPHVQSVGYHVVQVWLGPNRVRR